MEECCFEWTKKIRYKSWFKCKDSFEKDQRSGVLTQGVVKDILTNSPTHPHGIKVRLVSGDVGRVKEII